MIIQETVITSRQNPTVKWAASLQDAKGREASEAFLCEGEKLTFEAARASLTVTHIFVREGRRTEALSALGEHFSHARYRDTQLYVVSDDVMAKISTEKTPRDIISIIKYLDFFKELNIIYKEDFFSEDSGRMLALCSVRDPGNLGSVVRSAAAFGVKRLILSHDCVDIYSPKVVRAAMGSLFHIEVCVVRDMAAFLTAAAEAGRRVLAAELRPHAVPIAAAQLSEKDIVLIGNEGHGIPEELSALCAQSVYIPIAEATESLNAAVAAAVFMFAQRGN